MPLIRLVALTLFPTLVSALDCGQIRFTLAPQALTQCGKTRIQLSLPPGTGGVQMLIMRTSRGPVSLRSGAPQPLAEVAQYAGYSTPLDNDNTNDFDLPVASGTSLDVFIADRAEACPVSLGRNVGPGRNSCELVDLGPPGNDARVPVPPPALPAPAPVPLPPAQAASSLLTTSSVPFFVVGPSLLASSSFMAAAVASVTASSEVSRPGLAVAIQSSSGTISGQRGSNTLFASASTDSPAAGEANLPTPSTRSPPSTDGEQLPVSDEDDKDDGSKRKGIIVAISVISFLLLLTLIILYLFSRRRRQRIVSTAINRNSYTVDLSRQPSTIKQHVEIETDDGGPPAAWSARRSKMASGTVTLSARTRTSVDSEETLHPTTPQIDGVPPSPARSMAPFTNLAKGDGHGGGLFNIFK